MRGLGKLICSGFSVKKDLLKGEIDPIGRLEFFH
jgi:hypothetical protein